MKRKADGEEGDAEEGASKFDLDDAPGASAPKAWDPKELVDSRRVRTLKKGAPGSGPVVYWCARVCPPSGGTRRPRCGQPRAARTC